MPSPFHRRPAASFLLSVLLLLGSALSAQAQVNPDPPIAPATVSGDLTITWSTPAQANRSVLQERQGTTWTTVSATNSNGSITLSRVPGVYFYRVRAIYFTGTGPRGRGRTVLFSSEISVTVLSENPPEVDEIEVQIGYDFQFSSGDINADGRQDIYIERTSGDLDNGVLSEAIIVRQANGSYARFLPTAAQLTSAQNWVGIEVAFEVGDFNMDEVADLTLAGLPSNARQHLVVSSGEYFDRNALAVIEMTDAIEQFYGDLAGSITDAGHFDGAELAQVPGYNIRIMGQITTCIYFWGFPYCYSEVFTLFDEDISLADLGLGSFLGATVSKTTTASASKIASQRSQLESAGVYYSSTVHNKTAPTLAQHNVTTLAGTAEDKSTALMMMDALLPSSDPEVLVCVIWCGYTTYYLYESTVTFAWVDIWTPIMMGPSFDESANSKEAYDIAQILNKGPDAMTDDDWVTVGSILSATVAIPLPGTWPVDSDRPKRKLRVWGRFHIGIWAIIAADALNDYLRQFRWVNHYTGSTGWNAIGASGTIINPSAPVGGPIFFTHLAYPNAAIAEELLALCGEPVVGYYQVRLSTVVPGLSLPVQPKLCPPGSVQAGVYHNGGGWETILLSPVNASPIRRWPLALGY